MDLSRPLAMVSGGPDSVALLRVLVQLGGAPVVLHVDHGLRGEESREDARFVEDLCEGLGLACEVREANLIGGNLQEEARRERYRMAEEAADAHGTSTIVTGHTADDVAETVLLNLSRGAGLRGLAGIPPVRGWLARPLIERRRSEVLTYLDYLQQPYRTDPTNLTGKYARNRVRLEVLPVLEELYPGAGANIARAAILAREDLEALEGIAARMMTRRGAEIVVSLGELRAAPLALRRYAIRQAYAAVVPDAPPLALALVESVLRVAERTAGTWTLDLPGGVVVAARFGEELAFYIATDVVDRECGIRSGETLFADWKISATEVAGLDARDASRVEVAYLDEALGPYRVRYVREGDAMRPLGLGGTKKVMRAMMDRKVPGDLRRRMPVVVDGQDRVAWVFLGELDETFAVTPATEKVLRLEVRRTP